MEKCFIRLTKTYDNLKNILIKIIGNLLHNSFKFWWNFAKISTKIYVFCSILKYFKKIIRFFEQIILNILEIFKKYLKRFITFEQNFTGLSDKSV